MMLCDIVKGVVMLVVKVYCYMVSFMWIGIVEQEVGSGCYDFGVYVLDFGLFGLG